MKVTSDNFEEVLPLVRTAIAECDFMSMDFELSGLFPRNVNTSFTSFDTAQQRYDNAAQCARTFIPIQFGLCTAKWNAAEAHHTTQSFTFFIHPYCGKRGYQFSSDLSSLKFLSGQNFDFNTLFAKGIPFLSREKQASLVEFANEAASENTKRADMPLSDRDRGFVKETLETVKGWLDSTETKLQLPACNSFLIRVLYQEIPKHHPDLTLTHATVEGQKWRAMTLSRLSETERTALAEKEEADRTLRQERMGGFRRVVEMMCAAKKPLIGHNVLIDLCHFSNYFLGVLPESVVEFGQNLLNEFSAVIDTKYLASLYLDNTALGELFSAFTKDEAAHPTIAAQNDVEEQAHEAGYDAYMTAVIFLKLCFRINEEMDANTPIDFNNSKLSEHWNCINLSRMTSNMCLGQKQEATHIPDNVFHVYNFDKKVRTSDIFRWFADFGKPSVNWKDDSSAFVTINDPALVMKARAWAQTHTGEEFLVETLRELRNKEFQVPAEVVPLPAPVTPPPQSAERASSPPRRTRRSSLRGSQKRPRAQSIDMATTPPRKRPRQSEEPEAQFQCSIC